MTATPRHAILLLGSPHAGTPQLARALQHSGAGLPADASQEDSDFGASAALQALALRLNAEVGISIDEPGPVSVSGRALERSRVAVAAYLRTRMNEAVAAIAQVAAGSSGPYLIVGDQIAVQPAFWRTALEAAGYAPRVVLASRNPLAIAQQARKASGAVVRRTLFAWHALTLDALAVPDLTVVRPSEREDRTRLGAVTGLSDTVSNDPLVPAHPRDETSLDGAPLIAAQTRDLFALLGRWDSIVPAERSTAVKRLRAAFDEAVAVTGAARTSPLELSPPRAAAARVAPTPELATPSSAPPALLHYHLFKNAGTSVDAMLKANFGDRWDAREFDTGTPKEKHAAAVEWVRSRPEIAAFSSHTAPLPVPASAGRAIFPILFVRHPVLRLRSAYQFERRQDAETKGARLAKATDFRGYVDVLLADSGSRQARNFHVHRFAAGTPGKAQDEIARALQTAAALPFIGLVEAYRASVERLAELVQPMFPEFRAIVAAENRSGSGDDAGLESRLDRVRAELGDPLYGQLLEENDGDLTLWAQVRERYPA